MKLDVIFDHDVDGTTWMHSGMAGAEDWTVVVHSDDGTSQATRPEPFTPYPGCPAHTGEVSWQVDRYRANRVEIRRPGREPVFVEHPDA